MRISASIFSFLIVGMASFSLQAAEFQPVGLGVDVRLPAVLSVDGNATHQRQNFNMGLDARHWFTDQMNYGLRFGFDVEKRAGSFRQMTLAPGFAHHWMPLENWRPFMRLDIPVVLKGAINSVGSKSKSDVGLSGGVGFVWKLGDAIGLPNMEFRYDFDLFYLFGAGDALPVVGMDFFKAGLDYRF